MPFITQVLTERLPHLTIFGNDFETPEGIWIRDYIHVVDAARGHLSALNRISNGKCEGFEVYNLGMGKGYSVMQIVKSMDNSTHVLTLCSVETVFAWEGPIKVILVPNDA
uniref:UDP-glucose 4-epimerase n=1 Tax=Panagrolaimus davidi TaxID=227884 RepID=A0A914PG61_9BILA